MFNRDTRSCPSYKHVFNRMQRRYSGRIVQPVTLIKYAVILLTTRWRLWFTEESLPLYGQTELWLNKLRFMWDAAATHYMINTAMTLPGYSVLFYYAAVYYYFNYILRLSPEVDELMDGWIVDHVCHACCIMYYWQQQLLSFAY